MAYDQFKPNGTAVWHITSRCNYSCSYCFVVNMPAHQRRLEHCSDAVIEAVGDLLKGLERWRVKLIGGEATIHPRYMDIVRLVIDSGHSIGLTTNFSVPQSRFEEFLDVAGDRIDFVTVSLHLEQVRCLDEFIEKAIWFQKAKSPRTLFLVTSVVVEESFEKLQEIEQVLGQNGVSFVYQPQRVANKYFVYRQDIEEYIRGKMPGNISKIKYKDFFGTRCHTGQKYFIINPDGNVRRCQMPQNGANLGNVAKGTFRAIKRPEPCLSHSCQCEGPADFKMIRYNDRVGGISLKAAQCRAILREIRVADPRTLRRAVLKRLHLLKP